MDLIFDNIGLPVLMDVLALSVSAVLIGMLVANRRRYGRMVATPDLKTAFGSEIKLQMLTQQSQRSYANIQQALRREFAVLQRLSGGEALADETGRTIDQTTLAVAGPAREGHYDEAIRLIRSGADSRSIAERCGLPRSAVDLMIYMQHKRG
ncbi:MAG: DUF2802 domain-containing protein [Desulfobacterales bacterium]|jgi:hypothetical protein